MLRLTGAAFETSAQTTVRYASTISNASTSASEGYFNFTIAKVLFEFGDNYDFYGLNPLKSSLKCNTARTE